MAKYQQIQILDSTKKKKSSIGNAPNDMTSTKMNSHIKPFNLVVFWTIVFFQSQLYSQDPRLYEKDHICSPENWERYVLPQTSSSSAEKEL